MAIRYIGRVRNHGIEGSDLLGDVEFKSLTW